MSEEFQRELRTEAQFGRILTNLMRAVAVLFGVIDLFVGVAFGFDITTRQVIVFRSALEWATPTAWACALIVPSVAILVGIRFSYRIVVGGFLLASLWYSCWLAGLMMSGASLHIVGIYSFPIFMHVLFAVVMVLYPERIHR